MLLFQGLDRCWYSRLRFSLEAESRSDYRFLPYLFRRNLQRFAFEIWPQELADACFSPPVPDDPFRRKLTQKPSPPFVLLPPDKGEGELSFDLLIFDRWIDELPRFLELIDLFFDLCGGRNGLRLAGIAAMEASGAVHPCAVESTSDVPRSDLATYLTQQQSDILSVSLQFRTAVRLIRSGRPLFAPSWNQIAPFLLRRVTSFCAAWGGAELLIPPAELLELTSGFIARTSLKWVDPPGGEAASLGGLTGEILLSSPDLDQFLPVLHLATLLNAGKGAPYGLGHLLLMSC